MHTDKDGVYRGSHKELKEFPRLDIFATVDGHIASNRLPLEGLQVAQGLNNASFIFTDRPAYRAGQVVLRSWHSSPRSERRIHN